ncbi:bifunctional folylpolyglutamate synthase/dihydrofolate synthase [Vagococcus coleopterorum]|uniref:Dihydrofolate synthase/folylpolyglutamate synthase n=1 Tax=Vagococcus coleopterorum TaxID=2714946 RepID=A0A6G8APB0_9ENTE|nr:folylpolyglutamate synthase/dihydrofolate synthase family protein [Vagococcus coleopterorum]QIL46911.1 bifunctional folylpolyglutamate synthase/dihydrofolate synthase [Vagococcus coleopterorum]
MEIQEAIDWIHSRRPQGQRPGLTRIEILLEKLANPHRKLKVIHVAGTNGKGSVVANLRVLLEAQGLKVGTFTSPFITVFNERISINQQPIPDEDLIALVEKFKPLIVELDNEKATAGMIEFEVITAMMFDYFVEQQVDIAIVEVGLGGTLDCTNVVAPLISVITTVGLDHQDILGQTISEIAAQKAGIIKPRKPAVVGRLSEDTLAVVKQKAETEGCQLSVLAEDFNIQDVRSLGLQGERFTFENRKQCLTEVPVPLIGQHQVDNTAVALETFIQVSELLKLEVSTEQIRTALETVSWSGRMEQLTSDPLMIIDGAHNEPAINVLVENCRDLLKGKKTHVIFAALKTKEASGMLSELATIPNSQLYITSFDYPTALKVSDYTAMNLTVEFESWDDWQKQLSSLLKEIPQDDCILITGSLYFISQVRAFILGGR